MTRLKAPLLSLRASGPLANELSFDNRAGQRRVRTKPTPSQPRTLAQIYQRWDYQDYAAWWHTLPAATKQVYETQARPYHRTGFAHFMSYCLTDLPDIAMRLRLDETSGITAYDSGKQANNGTYFGTSTVDGKINNARYFDGLADYVQITSKPSLIPAVFTIEFWLKTHKVGTPDQYVICKRPPANTHGITMVKVANTQAFRLWVRTITSWQFKQIFLPILDTWYYITWMFDQAKIMVRINGAELSPVAHPGAINWDQSPLRLARASYGAPQCANITLDHLAYYNRILPIADTQRHLQRTFPLLP